MATFFGVKPIRLREQIKRNPNRFPDDFVFQLNEHEVDYLVSQNAIPSKQSLGGSMPFVFTEQGVAAVSGVIKSQKADEVSVAIVRAFVAMRKFLLNNASVFQRLDQMELKQLKRDEKIDQIFKALDAGKPEPDKGILFDGQVFDAYVFISNLTRCAIEISTKKQNSLVSIPNFIHIPERKVRPLTDLPRPPRRGWLNNANTHTGRTRPFRHASHNAGHHSSEKSGEGIS